MHWREWQKNSLLVLGSVGTVLLLGEAAARVFWQPGEYQPVFRADPVYGWTLAAGTSLHSVDTERQLDYTIQVNSLGLRDPERPRDKPAGVRRILLLGDSMAFGTGVAVGERCGDVLDERLGPGVEVFNAAVGGWGTDQEFLYLCREGFALQPDVVVLAVCLANDVVNNMLSRELFGSAPKPKFVLQAEELVYVPPAPRQPPSTSIKLKRFLKRSRLLRYVVHQERVLESRLRHPRNRMEEALYFPENLESEESHWSVFRSSYSERFEAAFRVTEALIAATHDSCRVRRIPFVLFAFPQKIEVDHETRQRELAHFGFDSAWFDLQAPYQRIQRLADRLGCPFVHPLHEFQEVHPTQPLFFARDGHPNAAGHALAAASLQPHVAQALRAESVESSRR